MIFQNQQANIKNVNGAIADIFANRPAPQQTYYLFYSTDTQQIFYDNGSWILIATGGVGVNIYNSDGLLTGNRIVDGDSKSITFTDLSKYEINDVNNIGLEIDYLNNRYSFGDFGGTFTNVIRILQNINQIELISDRQNVNWSQLTISGNRIHTSFKAQNVGLDLNVVSFIYRFGAINYLNATTLEINDFQQVLKTSNQGNDIGLKLDFANGVYSLGDPGSFANSINLVLDDAGRRLTTGDVAGVNGIDINFATSSASFGFFNTANSTSIYIDDVSSIISTIISGIPKGINLDLGNNYYQFGNFVSDNFTYLQIDDTNQIIYTINQSTQIGLKLDFANNNYWLGDRNNNSYIDINFPNEEITLFAKGTNNTYLQVASSYIQTQYNTSLIGLKLDFANDIYEFGKITNGIEIKLNNNNRDLLFWDTSNGEYLFYADMNNQRVEIGDGGGSFSGSLIVVDNNTKYVGLIAGSLYNTVLELDDTNQIIKTSNGGNDIGLKLDFANNVYQLGDFAGIGNNTYLQIDNQNSFITLICSGFGVNANFDGNNGNIEITAPNIIKTTNSINDIGLKLDFANSEYRFGQITGGNQNLVEFIDSTQRVEFKANGNTNGLLLDHNVQMYQFGKITGGNTTFIKIDDTATYPLLINGTNVLSGSSGGSSSQHLKININGTDYKIKLENP